MNIFKKIALINKVSKKIKAVKIKLDSSHVDESIKEHVEGIKYHSESLIKEIPEATGLVQDIWELIIK